MRENILRISQLTETQGVKTALLKANNTLFQQGDLSPCYMALSAHYLCGKKFPRRVAV
jgi:hypothetical protein